MARLIIISIVLLSIQEFVTGQLSIRDTSSVNFLIYEQLTESDKRKIYKLDKLESKAEKLSQNSDKNFEQCSNLYQQVDSVKDKKKRAKALKKSAKLETKAIKERVESLETYNDAFVQKYKIFKTDLKKYFAITKGDTLEQARSLELKAYNSFESADLDIQKTFYQVNSNDVFETLTRAYNSQYLGLLYQQQMYALFLDWDELIVRKLNSKIESIKNNSPYKDVTKDKETNTIDSINIINITVYDTVKVQLNNDLVVYKIQIAASKKPLEDFKLKSIYKNTEFIDTEKENHWYKYSIGSFYSYKDAQRFKMRLGIKGAFIIAFRNGVKTSLKELVDHYSYDLRK